MAKIKYVGPFPELDPLRLPSGATVPGVKRNHQFEVPDADAGYPPEARYLAAMVELADAVNGHPDHERARKLRDEIATLNPGDGLLAQPDNFQPVPAKVKETDE